MVNWRTYRITSKTIGSNHILFYLDNYVSYSNSSYNKYKHIYCSNCSPFYNWRENDFIEIDNDIARYRESGYYFSSISEVRLSCHGCGHSQTEYDDLKTRCSALERERNDLRTDRDNWRRKYDELKDQLNTERTNNINTRANERLEEQRTRSALESEKTLLERDLTNAKNEITSLKNLIEEGKTELGLVRTEKSQKEEEIKRIEEELSNLKIENERDLTQKINQLTEKESKLRQKDEEIQRLRSQRELSQEELLIEKLRSEKANLESFATELKIDLEKTQSLIDDHKQLFQAQKTDNQTNISTCENSIVRIKRDLQNSGVGIISIQEVCRKCEKIAELNWELTQIQSHQYQAQQEVPTNN
jgi:chromosome segregation ATPase